MVSPAVDMLKSSLQDVVKAAPGEEVEREEVEKWGKDVAARLVSRASYRIRCATDNV